MGTVLIGENMLSVRVRNRGTILTALLTRGPASRRGLSHLTGLNPTTITHIVRELIDQGLVREVDGAVPAMQSRPGPREVMLELNPGGAHAAGVQIGLQTLSVVLVDSRAEVLAEASLEDRGDMGTADVLGWVTQRVTGLARDAGVDLSSLVGVGVGVSGLVNQAVGSQIDGIDLAWRGGALDKPLAEALGVPVLVDNNVRAMALAETWFGAGSDVSDLLLLWVSNIVACGVVIGRNIHRGYHLAAGQIGHSWPSPTGPLCRCGKHGCLETRVSDSAVARQAMAAAVPGSTLALLLQSDRHEPPYSTVVQAARMGDQVAVRVLEDLGRELGLVVADLAALLNPQRVVLAGRVVAAAGDLVLDPLRAAVASSLASGPAGEVEIVTSRFGRNIGPIGAASLVLYALLYCPWARDLETVRSGQRRAQPDYAKAGD